MHHYPMSVFWDRNRELSKIRESVGKGAFGYVTGRRRIGKTALLTKACEELGGLYHQAVEGAPPQQLLHLSEEFRERLPIFREVVPKTWGEFFGLLSREKLPKLLVFDEFPYWVDGDPTLPSHLQKWIDHTLPKTDSLILVSGSSQGMLYSQFLKQSSPLYGRASVPIHLAPLSFQWFCRAMEYPAENPSSFERYSLVGGVPHYWKLLPKTSLLEQADQLYFEPSAILSEEPKNLVQDERITGTIPKAILDLVGRGVSKPSELAARLGTPQGNLSRPLAMLLELGLIHRELPFGESSRTTKKVLYSIQDPSLSFYYGTVLPLRDRWQTLSAEKKGGALNRHASHQWEIECRRMVPGSARYWEGDIEIDLIAYQEEEKKYLVAECKWQELSLAQEKNLEENLQNRFSKTALGKKLANVTFKIFSKKDVSTLATQAKDWKI